MTDDQIRIAIAESVGWQWWEFRDATKTKFYQIVKPPAEWPKRQNGIECKQPLMLDGHANDVPAYTEDLNAMQGVEQNLSNFECDRFTEHLAKILQQEYMKWVAGEKDRAISAEQRIWNATARQRAEAYLRTIGKWRE